MLDIGWSELLIVVTIAIIVVGPKELPALMRSIGAMIRKVKSTAEDFKYQFDDAMRESEFGEIASSVKELGENYSPDKIMGDVSSELDDFDGDDWLKGEENALKKLEKSTKAQMNDESGTTYELESDTPEDNLSETDPQNMAISPADKGEKASIQSQDVPDSEDKRDVEKIAPTHPEPTTTTISTKNSENKTPVEDEEKPELTA